VLELTTRPIKDLALTELPLQLNGQPRTRKGMTNQKFPKNTDNMPLYFLKRQQNGSHHHMKKI
jgi:hypothetical protein